ncbi:MAG: hypothetical protein H7Z75_07455 [Ferruginibacter sp.]|nr:hypothetical protein [Cytophagales bacterium]
MEQQTSGQPWWLLTVYGGMISLIGILLFRFLEGGQPSIGYWIGALMMVSGGCALWFGVASLRSERIGSWLILAGLISTALGVAMLVYADGSVRSFTDLIGYWALLFTFLQTGQAMYSYLGPGFGLDYLGKLIHVLLAILSGVLAFTLIMWPESPGNPLKLIGLLPVAMGGLLIALTLRLRNKDKLAMSAS